MRQNLFRASILLATFACTEPTTSPETLGPTGGPALAREIPIDSVYDIVDVGPAGEVQFLGNPMFLNNSGLLVVVGPPAAGGLGSRTYVWRDGALTDIGTLGGRDTRATALNERGDIVGNASTSGGPSHAFLWRDGVMTDLGTLGGAASSAVDVNNDGVVVGTADLAGGLSHAFRWEGGAMQDLGTLGGPASSAVGINDRGEIAGQSRVDTIPDYYHTFRWRNGRMLDLGRFPTDTHPGYIINPVGSTTPTGLAEDGTIVGWSTTAGPTGDIMGFVAPHRTMDSLPAFTARGSSMPLIANDRRLAAGQVYALSSFDDPSAVVWVGGVATSLGPNVVNGTDLTPCDVCVHQQGMVVRGMNARGQVVGRRSVARFLHRGYVWQEGVLTTLGTLGGRYSEGVKINDLGVVAGTASDPLGKLHWVLWRPRGTATP